jgi:hypothetical protein
MVVNFRTREISRGAHKLTQIYILIIIIIKDSEQIVYTHVNNNNNKKIVNKSSIELL